MSAEVGRIKGAIALELDADRLAGADFLCAVEAFLGLLKEITRAVDGDIPVDGWEVSIGAGSRIIDVFADAKRITNEQASNITRTLLKEMRHQEGKESIFSDNDMAVRHIKALMKLATREQGKVPVRMHTQRESAEITEETYGKTSGVLKRRGKNKYMGSVTGILDEISVQGKREFRITERLRERVIKCIADKTLMEEALRHFGKRVDVTGFISYDKQGLPETVRAESIRPYPDPSEIPHFTRMRGILKEYS